MIYKLRTIDLLKILFIFSWVVTALFFSPHLRAEEYTTRLDQLNTQRLAPVTSIDLFLRPPHPATEYLRPSNWPDRITIEDISSQYSVADANHMLTGTFNARYHCNGAPMSSVALYHDGFWDGVMSSRMTYRFYEDDERGKMMHLKPERPFLYEIAINPPSKPWSPTSDALGQVEVTLPKSGPGFNLTTKGVRNLLSRTWDDLKIVRIKETGEIAFEMGGAMNQKVCPGDKPYRIILTRPPAAS